VIFSLVYLIVRQILAVPVLLVRREVSKAELLALRHENAGLRRNVSRTHYEPADWLWFACRASLCQRQPKTDQLTASEN
jgi:putative transposase